MFVWKIKHGLVPNDFKFEFSSSCSRLRSGQKAILKPLPKIKGTLLSSFEESFGVRAAKLWNSLPSIVTDVSFLNAFVLVLDRYLNLIPDEPPVKPPVIIT